MEDKRLILGIGTGRCGTRSLALLLNRQPGAKITHEDYPLLPWRDPRPSAIAQRLKKLARRKTPITGDVASFYLPYVEHAVAIAPDIRIVCLERPKEEVVT